MSAGTSAAQQSNIEAQVVVGPPFMPALYVGQRIYSGPYSIVVTEEMARERERANQEIYRQWLAQLNRNNPENDEYYAEFKNQKIRRIFIRKVFCLLTLLILFTIGVISIFLFVPEAQMVLFQHWYLVWVSLAVFTVVYIMIVCNKTARRQFPCNWICLFLLTISMTFLIASVSVSHRVEVVMSAGITTAAVTMVITFFATCCSFDLTKRTGLLLIIGFGGLILLFIVIPIYIFTTLSGLNILTGVIGSVIISMYLYFDIQTIMGGRHIELSPDEIVYAVTRLYVDILTLYQYILSAFR